MDSYGSKHKKKTSRSKKMRFVKMNLEKLIKVEEPKRI